MAMDRRPKVTLIVAASDEGVIGRGGSLPWKLSADLKRFRQLTLGKPVVMGRKTWESLGKALPGRHNIVITRQAGYRPAGLGDSAVAEAPAISVVPDLVTAFAVAGDVPEVMVIGGAEVYALALPLADAIELTRVHADVVGDTFLPILPAAEWQEVRREDHPADERNDHPMSFVTLQRR